MHVDSQLVIKYLTDSCDLKTVYGVRSVCSSHSGCSSGGQTGGFTSSLRQQPRLPIACGGLLITGVSTSLKHLFVVWHKYKLEFQEARTMLWRMCLEWEPIRALSTRKPTTSSSSTVKHDWDPHAHKNLQGTQIHSGECRPASYCGTQDLTGLGVSFHNCWHSHTTSTTLPVKVARYHAPPPSLPPPIMNGRKHYRWKLIILDTMKSRKIRPKG